MSQWLTSERFGSGSDGAYSPSTGTDAPIDSACTGTGGTTSLTATNASFAANQIILIHQTQGTGAGNWELNVISSYVAGTITTKYNLANTYNSGSQVLVVKQYTTASIGGGATITGKAWNGTVGGIYAISASTSISIAGTLTLNGGSASGTTVGTGGGFRAGAVLGAPPGNAGESSTSASAAQYTANGMGGGGGGAGGGSDGGGGGGGHSSSGSAGTGTNHGSGGGTGGNAGLTTAVFGGAGGSSTQGGGAAGGNSGGFILLIGKSITITGAVTANGGNGGIGTFTADGGGGAGGSILLKGQILTLGSSLITATKGSAGDTGGGDGSAGRIHADYSATISGTTNPTLDSTQTSIFSDLGGSFLFNIL